jgi:hypothetical protein
MKLTLREQLSQFSHLMQTALFPALEQEVGILDPTAQRLVAVLEMIPLARFLPCGGGWVGRPAKDRDAVACAFVAKAVYGFSLTRQLLERLGNDAQLRRLCGWQEPWQVPSESTFSRAFAEFAAMQLPQFVHEVLIQETYQGRLIGHVCRDATQIEARERFPEKPAKPVATSEPLLLESGCSAPAEDVAAPTETHTEAAPSAKRRRTHKRYQGGKRPRTAKPGTRLEKQRSMSLEKMLAELPNQCDIGAKKSSKGYQQYWRGYKLHLDVADGQVPISAILTSASVHDSQVAIPLATMSTQRVQYCYELMDKAYDAILIGEHSRSLGHVPIIDPSPRGKAPQETFLPTSHRQLSGAEQDRYKERTLIERVNGRLKDEFGGRMIRVRGAAKVMAHLMFGILALTVDPLLRLGAPGS